MPKPISVLIADDEPQVLGFLKLVLETAGFFVETASGGKQALQKIQSINPDIAILDFQMPDLDGLSVCQQLRANPSTEHLPVIILSAAGTSTNKVNGLNLGADDFISKPVDQMEFLARVKMILRRTYQGLDANPLTRLPGNISIQNRIQESLASEKPLAVLYLDLNNFKAYNDAYGYESGDKVIKATADVILRVVREEGNGDFVGHIGGDDFIVVTIPSLMEQLAKRIIAEFDAAAPSFYNEADRARKKIISKDRQGIVREFPFISIAIGICHNQYKKLTSYAQISHDCAELKKYAKRLPGSAWFTDRRRRGPDLELQPSEEPKSASLLDKFQKLFTRA